MPEEKTNVAPETTQNSTAPTERPETPTLDTEPTPEPTPEPETPSEEPEVVKDIASKLGSDGEDKAEEAGDAPVGKKPNIIDLNNLSQDQVQDLQELFANTPRREKKAEAYNTIELRQIDGRVIVEWGQSYFDLKHDPAQRKDVMKTMIPVKFHDSEEFVDVLWKEDFISADRVTCKILKMEKEEIPEVVGTTLKRDKDGGQTSQEVEMYVNKVVITLTIKLPNGDEVVIDGKFAN